MLEHCQLAGHQLPTLGFPGVVHDVLLEVTTEDEGWPGDVTDPVSLGTGTDSDPSAHWEMTGDLNGGPRPSRPPDGQTAGPAPARARTGARFIEMIVYDDFHGGW